MELLDSLEPEKTHLKVLKFTQIPSKITSLNKASTKWRPESQIGKKDIKIWYTKMHSKITI